MLPEEIIVDECPECGSLEIEESIKWSYTVCICGECLYEWVQEDGSQ